MTVRLRQGRLLLSAVLIASWLVAACAPEKLRVPPPRVAVPKTVAADANVSAGSVSLAVEGEASASSPPAAEQTKSDRKIELISTTPPAMDLPQRSDTFGKFSNTNSLTAAAEGMPTRNFINYVFGELLKVNYIIVDGTPGLDDPVTFNAQKSVSSRQLFKLIGELLATRNISIVEKEGTYFIGPANAKTQQGLPIGYGRNPADVPDLPGNVFQIIPLRYGPNNTLFNAAQQFTNLTIFVDNSWDAYLVTGPRSEVLKLLDLVRLFDRPSVKGSRIGLINLTYIGPAEFVSQVTVLLANEGIVIGGNSPLTMVPLDRLGGGGGFLLKRRHA